MCEYLLKKRIRMRMWRWYDKNKDVNKDYIDNDDDSDDSVVDDEDDDDKYTLSLSVQ